MTPSADFLFCLKDEFDRRHYGQCTDQAVADYIIQNAPEEILKGD